MQCDSQEGNTACKAAQTLNSTQQNYLKNNENKKCTFIKRKPVLPQYLELSIHGKSINL
jgi:hypothetical protein